MGLLCGCTTSEGRDLAAWQASTLEAALDPTLPILDCHHHLWDPLSEPRGLVSTIAKRTRRMSNAATQRFLQRSLPPAALDTFTPFNYFPAAYELRHYKKDCGGHDVRASICIESNLKDTANYANPALYNLPATAKAHERERKWNAASSSSSSPHSLYVVPHIDLSLGKQVVLSAIEEHVMANEKVVGVRHSVAFGDDAGVFNSYDSRAGIMQEEGFLSGLQALVEKQMPFDTWLHFHQLGELKQLAHRMPDLVIVVDHIGSPLNLGRYKLEEIVPEWERGMRELSECPNVRVKLSGLLVPSTGIGQFWRREKAPSSDEVVKAILPFIKVVVECFGVQRCMFASNFPVDKTQVSYVVLYNAFKKVCALLDVTQEEKEMLFAKNAAKVYGISM